MGIQRFFLKDLVSKMFYHKNEIAEMGVSYRFEFFCAIFHGALPIPSNFASPSPFCGSCFLRAAIFDVGVVLIIWTVIQGRLKVALFMQFEMRFKPFLLSKCLAVARFVRACCRVCCSVVRLELCPSRKVESGTARGVSTGVTLFVVSF